jgi:two-component system chemotaxis response regulator CheB
VLKPASCDYARNLAELRDLLVPKLLALRPAVARGRPERRSTSRPSTVVVPGRSTRPDAIGIGVSTGGPRALHTILSNVPADLPPILIVQHMPQMFTHSLAAQLDRECAPRVVEARDGEEPQAGHVYLAPGGTQMKVVATGGEVRLRITDDPPEKGCKPAVDYLFRSLADVYGGRALAVVMTGMGDDGTLGCEAMKRTGCRVLAQDEDTSVVFGMPRSLIEAGLADGVLPLDRIAAAIIRIARTGDL